MSDFRHTLVSLESRIQIFCQQQRSFIAALDRCRTLCFQNQKPIRSLLQVMHYLENVTNDSRDKRILNMFMGIVSDLNLFRRELRKISKNFVDNLLDTIFAKWKKLSEPSHDFALLRAPYPFTQLNHLSCDEARNHFGGIISLIPVLIKCATDAFERIESKRALRSSSSTKLRLQHNNSNTSQQGSRIESGDGRSTPATPLRKNRPSSAPTRTRSNVSVISFGSAISSPVPSSIDIPYTPQPATTPPVTKQRPSSASTVNYRVKLAPGTPEPPKTPPVRRPSSASPATKSKKNQSVQTPQAFKTTLQPVLDWPHKTLTYSDMKKLLRERRIMIARPQWRP